MGLPQRWKDVFWLQVVATFLLLLLFISEPVSTQTYADVGRLAGKKPVNAVLLLPMDNKYMFSYARVFPALEIAMENLQTRYNLLSGYYLKVHYNDTKCNEALGMRHAIEYFFKKEVNVFFGPVCDYVIAPVIRQATFWNIPVVTVGANAWGFVKERKNMFPMLTRVGPVNHHSLLRFFLTQVTRYSWKKFQVVYEKDGQNFIATDFCHLTVEVLVKEMQELTNFNGGIKLDVKLTKIESPDLARIFLDAISLNYGVSSTEHVTFITHLRKTKTK